MHQRLHWYRTIHQCVQEVITAQEGLNMLMSSNALVERLTTRLEYIMLLNVPPALESIIVIWKDRHGIASFAVQVRRA